MILCILIGCIFWLANQSPKIQLYALNFLDMFSTYCTIFKILINFDGEFDKV